MPVRAIDVGYGNVKYCQGETEGQLLCGHFPSIASLFTGMDRDAWIIPQPVGGFISYFMDSGQLGNLEDLKSLEKWTAQD